MLRQAKASQVVKARRWRPAMGVAVSLLAGVLAHRWVAMEPGVGLGVIAAIVVLAVVTIRRPLVSGGLLLVAIFLGGAVAGRLEMHYYPAADIGAFTASERQLARVEVVLEDTPRVLSSGGANRPTTPRQFARASVRQILTQSGWTEASGSVLLHLEPPNPELAAGQTLRVAGWLSRLSPAMNPGQFDFSGHYRRERVVASFSSRQAGNVQIVSPAPTVAPLKFVRTKSRELLAAGFNEAWATEAALLRALLLGDRDPLLRDIQDQFLRTGTSHHLAISGMHVAVVAAFVHFLLRLARVSPRTNAIATLGIVFLYAAAALPNPPVVRSVLLCGIVIVGTLLRRDADLVQLLALSVIGMLIYSPLDVYDVGFQLSFGTVLGLMLFARPVFEGLFPVDIDMALAPRKRVGQVIAARDWSWRWIKGAIAAAAVAWFVSLPMILHHFDRMNPWAIVASIVLAPIVFFALIGGVLKVALTLACPLLAAVWAAMAAWPIWGMHHAVDWLGRLPLSDVTLKPPPVAVTLLYYAVLLAALHPKLTKRVRRGVVAGACGMILVVPVLVTAMVRHHPDETRVTILSVGAGSCAVIETNDGGTTVIDAGSSGSSELYRNVIEPYFRTRAVRGVDTVIVSHADIDHYGGFADLARDRAVAATYLTPYFLADESPSAQELASVMPGEQVVTGPKTIRLTADTTLELLWPPPDLELDSNDSSMVVKLSVAGRSVLFPGDIQGAAMAALLGDPAALKADVLVAPHHGSFEDATPAFVAAVAPSTIVSSDDRTPSSKQRMFDEAVAPLPILHTRDHGAITIVIRRDGTVTVTPFRP